MIDGPFRAVLPRFTKPLLAVYTRFGVSPNQLTCAGLVIAIVAAIAVAYGLPYLALVLWWLSRLLDGTDGIYARQTGRVSDFGGYLDILFDMAAYGAMILGFAQLRPDIHAWPVILFFYILCITSALALGVLERQNHAAKIDNRTLRLASGLAEGGETGIAYSLFLLFPSALFQLTTLWMGVLATTIVTRTWLAQRLLAAQTVR